MLLAIDPGTYTTGAALFDGRRLVHHELIWAGDGNPRKYPLEERFVTILAALDSVRSDYPDIVEVACERITSLNGRSPSPELAALVRRIKTWARTHKLAWDDYHPSTVVSKITPAGYSGTSKEKMRAGVQMVYGQTPTDFTIMGIWSDVDQNEIDAIAVGHCHIVKQEEKRILEQ